MPQSVVERGLAARDREPGGDPGSQRTSTVIALASVVPYRVLPLVTQTEPASTAP